MRIFPDDFSIAFCILTWLSVIFSAAVFGDSLFLSTIFISESTMQLILVTCISNIIINAIVIIIYLTNVHGYSIAHTSLIEPRFRRLMTLSWVLVLPLVPTSACCSLSFGCWYHWIMLWSSIIRMRFLLLDRLLFSVILRIIFFNVITDFMLILFNESLFHRWSHCDWLWLLKV